MPRAKKPGAPEPKKRSRNGCWPCKARKVKCDEGRPTCLNCQRQGETCDYSIRLNWEGRGKNKNNTTPGEATFSVNVPNDVSSRPSTGHSALDPPQASLQTTKRLSGHDGEGHQLPSAQDYPSYTSGLTGPRLPPSVPGNLMIDPALMDGPQFQENLYSGRPDYQHTQSYERYRSPTPSTPLSAAPSAISRLRQTQYLDGSLSPSTEYATRSPSVGTFSNQSRGLESPALSLYDNIKDDGDSYSPEAFPSDRPSKRARYHPDVDSPYDSSMPPPNLYNHANLANSIGNPSTPAASLSDDGLRTYTSKLSPHSAHDSPDIRRLSVSSLLSGPPGMPDANGTPSAGNSLIVQDWSLQLEDVYQDTVSYGIDRGFKDLDIGRNNDMDAISGSSPLAARAHLELVLENNEHPSEFGFGIDTGASSKTAAYYDKPVPICIPRILEPLPSKLLENPMNLLYFHHFLHHTAGCLIPHNCSSNPFKSILPQMAVQDENLMNLLLAYSASHRARYLRQPEPATRIALWVQDVFPKLRHALDDPNQIISDSNLATAIMLASLEIVSPKAFGVEVPWQNHLDMARQMIAARGGPQRMQTTSRGDKVSSFLWSWFAYLDVLGSLSGGKSRLSSSWILDYESDAENDYQIDCILGFTSQCIQILGKIAELSRICDSERIGADSSIRDYWKPSKEIVERAGILEADLAASRLHPAKPCSHMQSSGEAAYQWDSVEMTATNEAYHWAGLIHLHRRILGKPVTDHDVQTAVREVFGALFKVRRGSSAEACLLFPMFTAGCDTQDAKQRADMLERIKCVEALGMSHVHKARTLMERAWETGKPWETLVAGEFFG